MMKSKLIPVVVLYLTICIAQQPIVHRITINGAINPVVVEYINEAIVRAENVRADALIIEMDTPGGLMSSTHDIVKDILAARVAVIVYVSPSGSRAGSAGVFIATAAHIAAMAPGTNIGSAHPVGIDGQSDSAQVMMDKVVNDAVAHIRSVAEKRGRNIEWVEKAVRESANITETEALANGVVDFVVPSLDSLLRAIDGREIDLNGDKERLHTRDARITSFAMTWRQKALYYLADPNVAYFLMMLAMLGIMGEMYHPGTIIPGVVGGICLLLTLYSFQMLPVNFVGIFLLIFAVILFLLEIKVTSYGILTIGGIISFVAGSIMLLDRSVPFLRISWELIITAAVMTAVFFAFAVTMVIRAKRRQPTTGKEGLVNEEGVAIENLSPAGRVEVHGEIWQAVGLETIKKGSRVVVVAADPKYLRLTVKPKNLSMD
jgi:membrane-bound serine protease (ClpP class)